MQTIYPAQTQNQNIDVLYNQYSQQLLNHISYQFPDILDAKDILQDTFLKICNKMHLFDENKSSFKTWLYNICHNTCIDHKRKNLVRRKYTANEEAFYSIPTLDGIGIRSLLDRLPANEKSLIELAYYQGYTHQEIADECQLPLGTVKTRINRAMKSLRSWMPECLN